MAHTFIVEDGTGVPGANSYVTVGEADDYLSANIFVGPAWDLLDTETKEKLLIWASRYLDQHAIWRGYPTYPSAALGWPRSYVRTCAGVPVSAYVIPLQIKQATMEMARYLMVGDRSAPRAQDGIEEIKVDVIEIKFDSSYVLTKVPDELNWMLDCLGTLRGGTGGFGRIKRA